MKPEDANRSLLTPTEAVAAILEHVRATTPEQVPLAEALGRVLASDVSSPVDMPHWDNSAMDGYALGEGDAEGDGVWSIVEEIPAGAFPTKPLGRGECARIFTGAPVPEGTVAVVRQEDTSRLDDDRVRVEKPARPGANIRRRGEDIRRDAVVLERGAVIGPGQLGVLASVAAVQVAVHRRPTVALLSTGDEIADLDERDAILRGEKIASSNTYTMLGMSRLAGAQPLNLGIAGDERDDVERRLERARGADLLVTSAGMSVGEHDYLRAILEEQGDAMRFWRLKMRPGAPVGFGRLGAVPWIGLPGNPVSTMVTFELFARPAIRKLLGHRRLFRRTIPVRIGEPISLRAPLRHFLRVRLEPPGDDGIPTAHLTGPQGSGILTSMARADALLVVREDALEVKAGEIREAMRLDEATHVEGVSY